MNAKCLVKFSNTFKGFYSFSVSDIAFVLKITFSKALVSGYGGESHVLKDVGLNPSTVYWICCKN